MHQEPNASAAASGSARIKLVLAWALVGIPLIWGVLETLRNALKLFQ